MLAITVLLSTGTGCDSTLPGGVLPAPTSGPLPAGSGGQPGGTAPVSRTATVPATLANQGNAPQTSAAFITPVAVATEPPAPLQGTLSGVKPGPSADCDQAAPASPFDITIPDNTVLEAGETFTKIWRLQNTGTCTWSRMYRMELFSGPAMGGPGQVYLLEDVPPGDFIDLSVDLVAPDRTGVFQSNWKLRNAEGAWFGIGPSGDAPFWVRIEVVLPPEDEPTEEPAETEASGATETPVQEATSIPAFAATGTGSLVLEQALDLDYYPEAEAGGEDLRYTVDPAAGAGLAPAGRTVLGIFGPEQPEMQDCLDAGLENVLLPLANLEPGSYLCYRTNLGLPGWIRLAVPDPGTPAGALDFELFTWWIP